MTPNIDEINIENDCQEEEFGNDTSPQDIQDIIDPEEQDDIDDDKN